MTHVRVVVQIRIVFRIIEKRLKETMTVVAKIETDRIFENRVSNELVDEMFGGKREWRSRV